MSIVPRDLSRETLVPGQAWRGCGQPQTGQIGGPHPVANRRGLLAMLVGCLTPWVLGRPSPRRNCPVPHERRNPLGMARCENCERSAARSLAEEHRAGRSYGVEHRQEVMRSRLEVRKCGASRQSRRSLVVQDEPREASEPLEQVGERVDLPHDLDVAEGLELKHEIDRPLADGLIGDADAVVGCHIPRHRGACHAPTLSDRSFGRALQEQRRPSAPVFGNVT